MNLQRAEKFAVYVVPALLLFGAMAWGLWHTPNVLWGMYANQDGMWAVWNAAGILEWGRFLDLSPFNPLSGMGSLFLPNLPWLNPGAAALALPMPRDLTYLISYAIYFVEIFISIVVLFRVLGLSPIKSSLGAQFYLLMLFPPMCAVFKSLSWYALAPVNAHLVAIANLSLALFLVLGKYQRHWRNIVSAAGIIVLVAVALFSAPLTFLTYVPVYGSIAMGFLLWQWRNRQVTIARLYMIAALISILFVSGFIDYFRVTAAISARASELPAAFAAGMDLLKPAYWLEVWNRFNVCDPAEQPLCSQHTVFFVHAAAAAGALIQVWRRSSSLRVLAVLFLMFLVGVEIYTFVGYVHLLGKLHTIRVPFVMWSAYTFFALFAVLLFFSLLDLCQHVGNRILGSSVADGASTTQIYARGTWLTGHPALRRSAMAGVALAVPLWAGYLWQTGVAPYQPPAPEYNKPIGILGKSSVRGPVVGAITSYLIEHASLRPGQPFRGYVATYFGDARGHVRKGVNFSGQGMAPDIYADARAYLDQHFGNRFQEMDLWEFGIPTLEEYGQWITKSLYAFVNGVFGEPGDRFNPDFLHIYKLDLDSLAALGVRFVITDVIVSDSRVALRSRQDAKAAGPIYLYELIHPNTATYSPTRAIKAGTFQDAISTFKAQGKSLADSVIVFDDLAGSFQRAEKIDFRMTRDGFRVSAESAGPSLILLPVQFSKCFKIEPLASNTGAKNASLLRANGVQTLLKFAQKVDISVRFELGLLGNTECRSEDARDLARLGIH